MRAARSRLLCIAVATSCLLAACGDGAHETAATTSTTDAPRATVAATTVPPTTIAATTTIAPTTVPETTIAATTTVPGTTVPATLPMPVAAPADSRGQEPVLDLGQIAIPKIGLNATMYEGIRLTTLDRGPGHWPGSALPGGYGNVVVAGHRTSHAKPFRHLEELAPGDDVIFTDANGAFTYHVTSTEIVTPDALWIVDQTPGYTATLFACHPPGSTKQRIVVHLELATV